MDINSYKIHELAGQIQNIYMAEYSDGILLLDGGCRSDTGRIIKYITGTMKRDMDDLKLIIVSHLHPDHAGAAPFLRRKFGIPIAAYHTIDYWYSRWTGALQHFLDWIFAWAVSIMMGQPFRRMWYSRRVKPDFLLKDGDTVPFFNDWKTISVPGHTSHDIVLLNIKDSTLYAADMVLTINGKWSLPFPVTLPGLMEKSLKKLNAMKFKRLIMAHGGIREDIPEDLFTSLIPLMNNRPPWSFRMIRPLTMLPPDIRRHR